jgi:hypothetical protein
MWMVVLAGWISTMGPSSANAGSLVLPPTSVGNLRVTEAASPFPRMDLSLGGSILLNSFEGRSGGSYFESALKFDLSSLHGTQIISAAFTFTVELAQQVFGGPATLNVDGFYSDSPIVAIPDFSSPTTFLGTTGPLPDSRALNETFNIDATSYIRALIDAGESRVGFLTSVGSDSAVFLYGDTSAGASFAPGLSLNLTPNAVPEPSSLALYAIACVVGLTVARSRTGRAA